ncbi:MAG: LamG-like jellyroll fold domain-containing protein, partial [Bacteroidota bacterium]
YIKAQSAAACLNFDGVNDYVDISNNNGVFNVSAAHNKTAQVWYKSLNSSGNAVRIFSTGSANWTSGFWLGFAPGSNFLMVEMSDGVGTGQVINATVTSRGDNNWHHATAVMNGSLASFYQDGVLQGTINISGEAAMPSSGAIHIGNSYNNESGSYFTGSVDELRIWDRALCSTEIMNTKDCELSGNEFGLVAYYQFNQGVFNANNSAVASLNGSVTVVNTGTLTNFGLSGLTSNWTQPSAVLTGNTCSLTSTFSISVASSAICYGQYAILTSSGAITYTWYPGVLTGNSNTIIPTASIVYTVYGLNSGGCLGIGNFSLNVYNNTTLSVTPSSTLICPGQSATLIASGSSSGNYYWTPNGQQTAQIVVSPTVLSVYTVSSQIGGCSAYGTVAINISTVSVVLSGNTVICVGKSTTITASGANTYTWLPSTILNNVAVLNPSISTIYTVNGTNSQGCIANQTINIRVNPNPTLNVASNNIDICKGNSTILNASGANNYSWSPVVSTSNSVLVNPTQTTTYNVIGTNTNNCSSAASIVINVNTCIGMGLYRGFDDLKVYPNPFIHILKVEGLIVTVHKTIEISNLMGEIVYSKLIEIQESEFDLSSLSKGIYIVTISTKEHSFKTHILKE